MPGFVYLASKSPRRQQLLGQIGLRFELLLPDAQEDTEALESVRPGESPTNYVRRVVLAKLDAARHRLERRALPPAPILCADTTVALGGTILGKPADRDDAIRMLELLAGRTHRVLTAIAVARSSRCESLINVSRVTFARLSRREIEAYVDCGESLDKAGAYGIQGAAARFVRRIDGSHSGIMGLPLYETSRLLRGAFRDP
jgi:septum formation protein